MGPVNPLGYPEILTEVDDGSTERGRVISLHAVPRAFSGHASFHPCDGKFHDRQRSRFYPKRFPAGFQSVGRWVSSLRQLISVSSPDVMQGRPAQAG